VPIVIALVWAWLISLKTWLRDENDPPGKQGPAPLGTGIQGRTALVIALGWAALWVSAGAATLRYGLPE
jgi:hypothetical protein